MTQPFQQRMKGAPYTVPRGEVWRSATVPCEGTCGYAVLSSGPPYRCAATPLHIQCHSPPPT
eukprot:CAMPEP_0174334740 /NCGR_PEP_ID=MMETSP0810-20121108/20175_1 /TAXON_ID=73025 ORGANISM="Eutreptiella gymnastica-like, Strain CCMP1594" /NCGR_SAMPLE_ID=MMETSP0810 /ASSEMBLY_ACC=CAM_ASM_000659 /LENGTH=61 /DNA_ID=CAMNT_0015452601 /DNA_START=314 /DNA_END=495 /DNA_ORIENTATION=+